MGFFSELKSDLSQAVNTLMPDDKPESMSPENEVKEEIKPADISSMLNRLDDIKLEELQSQASESDSGDSKETGDAIGEAEPAGASEQSFAAQPKAPIAENTTGTDGWNIPATPTEQDSDVNELARELSGDVPESDELEYRIEEETLSEIESEEPQNAIEALSAGHVDQYVADVNAETETQYRNGGGYMDFDQQTPTDEVALVTEGMFIKGDLATTGSIDVIGKVSGNIKCLGKLNITGEISGDSDAAEIYAESARITGEVRSKGSVKVGQSTVIVGNIFGSSAVIAGAVKGDIDVHGPVVLDTTAIVMGNIKSQSVQINNGAVIEGMCSQAYADVNPSEFFEGLKNR